MKGLKGLYQTLICMPLMFQQGVLGVEELLPQENYSLEYLDVTLLSKNSHIRLEQDLFTNYSRVQSPNEKLIVWSRRLGEPVQQDNLTQTKVSVRFHPVRLVYLDDKRQSFKLTFILQFNWNDRVLKWDPSRYENIKKIHQHQEDMWVPPVMYYNTLDESTNKQLGFDKNVLQINYPGYVSWTVTDNVQFNCVINVQFYPFDVQNCSVDLVLFQYQSTEVLLKTPEEPISVTRLFDSGGTWKVLQFDCTETNLTATHTNGKQRYSMVSFRLVLLRRQTYFIINIMLPLVFLSLTVPTVFLLPPESGAKIVMSFTALLSYGVYLSTVSDRLPQTSQQTCILQVYLAVLYGNSTAAVILSVFVLRMHYISPEVVVGSRVQRVVVATRKFVCLKKAMLKVRRDPRALRVNITSTGDIKNGCQNRSPQQESGWIKEEEDFGSSVDGIPSVKTAQCELEGRGKDVFSIDLETCAPPEPAVNHVTWHHVAETVDRVMFIWFFFSTIVLTLCTNLYIRSNYRNNAYSDVDFVPSRCHQAQMELYK